MKNRWINGLAVCAGLIGVYYVARHTGVLRWVMNVPYLDDAIAEKLPVAKNLSTISDTEGNYDLDGVSFDTEGVIVSSDATKEIVAPI